MRNFSGIRLLRIKRWTAVLSTVSANHSRLSQNTSASFTSQASDDKPPKVKEISERTSGLGLTWIMSMRFYRRGEGLKSSRAMFRKARGGRRRTSWEVYEAAAPSTIARKPPTSRIFEKGLELFGDEVEFVSRYLGLSISINDDNSELNPIHLPVRSCIRCSRSVCMRANKARPL